MTKSPCKVLFLCTGNSARSIIAESILRREGEGRFQAFSAGSKPKGRVNPLAIRVLQAAGYPTSGLRSKGWEEFAAPGAPAMDVVITVCDDAASESCPIWPGHPVTAHWGMKDPATVQGSDDEKHTAFLGALRIIRGRIDRLTALPVTQLDDADLRSTLRAIGQEEAVSLEDRDANGERALVRNQEGGE